VRVKEGKNRSCKACQKAHLVCSKGLEGLEKKRRRKTGKEVEGGKGKEREVIDLLDTEVGPSRLKKMEQGALLEVLN
jgi:hypothetical protein